MARDPGKHRFRQFLTFNASTAGFFFSDLLRPKEKFGRVFGKDLEEIGFFGRRQQIAEGFLL